VLDKDEAAILLQDTPHFLERRHRIGDGAQRPCRHYGIESLVL